MTANNLRPHSFDGIQEFDNRLPNWWLWTFYLTCIFSVGYWIHYHTLGTGSLPEEVYRAEMRAAEEGGGAGGEATNEALRELAGDPEAVAAGREVFASNCVACHHTDGSARIGGTDLPGVNLTDEWWLHGHEPVDIHQTITGGAPNGMQAWGPLLGPTKVRQVTAYMLAELVGKGLEGKPPDEERAVKAGSN